MKTRVAEMIDKEIVSALALCSKITNLRKNHE